MEANAKSVPECKVCWPAVMILLLLGTNPYPFHRLLNAVDEWAKLNKQKVIAQTGHTPVDGVSIECHDFVDHAQVIDWIQQSEFVILEALKIVFNNKKLC